MNTVPAIGSSSDLSKELAVERFIASGWIDKDYPRSMAMRADMKELVQCPYLINRDLLNWVSFCLRIP